ncbi:MAG: transposase [Lachnospiraceae bacterium]|nr:transposase [Lachnospiraceae bacterium]
MSNYVSDDFAELNKGAVLKKRTAVPIWRKELLTLEEAAEYTGLGLQKLRDLSNGDDCDFVLWNHTKRMFKRRKLEQYIESLYSI